MRAAHRMVDSSYNNRYYDLKLIDPTATMSSKNYCTAERFSQIQGSRRVIPTNLNSSYTSTLSDHFLLVKQCTVGTDITYHLKEEIIIQEATKSHFGIHRFLFHSKWQVTNHLATEHCSVNVPLINS